MKHYSICGLTVASDLDLPIATVEAPAEPDIVVYQADVPTAIPDAKRIGPTWQVKDRQILLRVPGIARFLMTEGRELAFEPEAGRSDQDVRIFLLGSALGALLHQRGALVLHAGAVAVDGQAVLFCGTSGAGKSSLVAALSVAGYPVIADDICVVQSDVSGRSMVAPDGRRLKLWADAIEGLSIGFGDEVAVRPGIQKYWIDPPTPALKQAAPVRATYFLREDRPPHRAGIEPLSLVDGMSLLRDNAYRRRLVNLLGQEVAWFGHSLSLMRAGGAFHLTRRMGFDALPACIEELERHWQAMVV